MNDILMQVQERIAARGLSMKDAADQIGVTPSSLERHLAGAYVRSDSLAKYRAWLAGRRVAPRPPATLFPDLELVPAVPVEDPLSRMEPEVFRGLDHRPYNVVDLFSGCGGMSLGFDLFHEEVARANSPNEVFRTILALDIEEKVVELQNENHPPSPTLHARPARWVDLSDFFNAAEVLAFYLDHYARQSADNTLARALAQLPRFPLDEFKSLIRRLDAAFLAALHGVRSGAAFRQAYGQIDSTVFGQTSVIGFHAAVGLPLTGTALPSLGPLAWTDHNLDPTVAVEFPELGHLPDFDQALRSASRRFKDFWTEEVDKLRERTAGRGKGQLASSAGRIRRFLDFVASEPMEQVRSLWVKWRAAREALRVFMFDDETEQALRARYQGSCRVDVLLGGPPCQGFSRIGRGKIRSLREHHVHVGADPEAGDIRNRLLLKYVLFVSALEPRVFLFENVRHFQASVQTPEGTYLATEILRDAIKDLSEERLDYSVRDRIIDCSRHLVPQTRERFVMIGVRADVTAPGLPPSSLPEWCLALPSHEPVSLRDALQGLPAPLIARGQRSGEETGMSGKVQVNTAALPRGGAPAEFLGWVTQPAPFGFTNGSPGVDGHYIRDSRADDQAFFELLGPGRRWMDYRCDESETLRQLTELIQSLLGIVDEAGEHGKWKDLLARLDRGRLEELSAKLDGSLSLRLLLESVPAHEGELHHHLLTPNYLAKREGNNGDWIARLHPDRPCKTIVSHMAKDTYAYVHPSEPRTLSVREAARVQTFPDWFRFGRLGLVDAFRAVGNAVPPLLSHQFARKVARLLRADDAARNGAAVRRGRPGTRRRTVR